MIAKSVRFDATGLFYRVTDPADERLDAFDPGATDCAKEEARYFQTRAWTGAVDGRECSSLQLVTGSDDIVGYVAFQIVPKPHPARRSRTHADYLFLYHLWIAPEFHGVLDDDATISDRWSNEVMRLVEELALDFGCVGVYLNVRVDNLAALRLYDRLAYVGEGEYTSKATDHLMRRMRKIIG